MASVFGSINSQFDKARRDRAENEFIVESVMGVEEVLPGSESEMEDIVDVDSVPDDVYKKIDAELDKIVGDPEYDDTEAEELVDDDDDIDDNEIDAVINEAVGEWLEQDESCCGKGKKNETCHDSDDDDESECSK